MIYCCKEKALSYIHTVCHHEIFHFVDHIKNPGFYCKKWDSLNVDGFKYGDGGANHREWKPLDPAIVGFLNFYSTTAIEEDKAEVYAAMINQEKETSDYDEVLMSKFARMKMLMQRYDSKMYSESFFESLKELRDKQRNYFGLFD